jgi:hypothetical protein
LCGVNNKNNINNNNIQFNSIQFNGYLLMGRLNSTSAYDKASTKTEIQRKTIQIHKSNILNKHNKNNNNNNNNNE